MTFDQWWDTTKTAATPETFAGWEHTCRQAWNAALAAQADAQPMAPSTLRQAFEDECARTDQLLTILGAPPEQCRSEGGSLMPRKVLELMSKAPTLADVIEQAAERVRNTIIVEGETPAKLREAVAQRVQDLGKSLAITHGAEPATAQPVAYRVRHPKNPRCFYVGTEPPSEFRSDTGKPDEYFGGEVTPLYAAAPPARQPQPLSDEHVQRVVRSVQPHLAIGCKAWRELEADCRYWLEAERGIGEGE